MRKRSARFSKWSIYIISGSLIILFLTLIFFITIIFYPIQTISKNFQAEHFSKLIAPWPMSALETEMMERRRLKRYAKKEQVRRMEKQLQKMEILQIPIYDLFLDNNAEISNGRIIHSADGTSFLWPVLPGKKIFHNFTNSNFSRKSSSVLFPFRHWSQVTEGILLLGGEEIKASIPFIRGRRNFGFTIFLLTPGSLKVSLGQYVWSKTFTEDDVQKKIKISIPINDSKATHIKIVSISSSFYLLNAHVNHTEYNARSPIRVSTVSKFWLPNKSLLLSSNKNDSPEEDSFDEKETKKTKKDEENEQQKLKKIFLKDPLEQKVNPHISTNENYSTAFGYNILFIQTPKIKEYIFKNKKILQKIAPTLSSLLDDSIFFSDAVFISENVSENFRKFIHTTPRPLNEDNIVVTKDIINEEKINNIYYEMRKYGYQVVSIAYPEALYFKKNTSNSYNISYIYGKWLEKNDWELAEKNIKIDDRTAPASGLDAIFKTSPKSIPAALSQKDFSKISKYLLEISKNVDSVPDWGANEYILINHEELYVPRTVEAFQNWTQENPQSRFLAHILIDNKDKLIKPTLKDLGKSLSTLGFSAFLRPTKIKELSKVHYIDRAIGQILDTLTARKIENRTIIFILSPVEKKESKKISFANGIFKIPGLIPKKNIFSEKIKITDISKTLFANVGIPLNKFSEENLLRAKILEIQNQEESKKTEKNRRKFYFKKYSIIIKPDEQNCSPFLWNSKNEQIIDIQSNYPIYQKINENLIEIFPCEIKRKIIHLTWYQKSQINSFLLNNIEDFLGGNFLYKKPLKELPYFYFGSNFISSKNIAFYFDSIQKKDLEKIFIVEDKFLKKYKKNIENNFLSTDVFEKNKKGKTTLAKKTKVGFLVSPL
jgi:hypothetical protein